MKKYFKFSILHSRGVTEINLKEIEAKNLADAIYKDYDNEDLFYIGTWSSGGDYDEAGDIDGSILRKIQTKFKDLILLETEESSVVIGLPGDRFALCCGRLVSSFSSFNNEWDDYFDMLRFEI